MPPKIRRNAVFAIVPLLAACLLARWTDAKGPFWLANNSDPSYVYLMAGLNLSELHRTGEVHHPGTPSQVLDAILLRVRHTVVGKGNIADAVLHDPESNLAFVMRAYFALFLIALAGFGWCVARATTSVPVGLAAQALLLVNWIVPYHLALVGTEPLMMVLSLALQSACLLCLVPEAAAKFQNPMLFAALVGVGIANKANFIGLGMLPLFVLPRRRWATYVGLIPLALVVATLPIVFQYRFAIDNVVNRGLHNGAALSAALVSGYALGLPDVLPLLVSALPLGALLLWWDSRSGDERGAGFRRLIAGAMLTQIAVLALSVRNADYRFMFPALTLSGLVLAGLIASAVRFARRPVPLRFAPAALTLLLAVPLAREVTSQRQAMRDAEIAKAEGFAVYEASRRDFPGCRILGAYPSSSPLFALQFGNLYSLNIQSERLARMYPGEYFLLGPDLFANWFGRVTMDEVRKIGDCLVIHSVMRESLGRDIAVTNLLPERKSETLFRARLGGQAK